MADDDRQEVLVGQFATRHTRFPVPRRHFAKLKNTLTAAGEQDLREKARPFRYQAGSLVSAGGCQQIGRVPVSG